jgi:short-chain fatty acids transporter
MQMALIIVTGYVRAPSRPVFALITRLASVPRTPRAATVTVAVFAMTTSWVNWGFSLIFSAMLAREIARGYPRVDYRALAASSFLGLGSVWAQGLSGSTALQMATPGALQPAIRDVVAHDGLVPGGMIPLSSTIFLWQSFVCVAVEIVVVAAVVALATPMAGRARSAESLGVALSPPTRDEDTRPLAQGERIDRSPVLTVAIVVLGAVYIARYFSKASAGLSALNVKTPNLVFLLAGFALHGTPHRLMRAVRDATAATWGCSFSSRSTRGSRG